jgi:hypothetical protein
VNTKGGGLFYPNFLWTILIAKGAPLIFLNQARNLPREGMRFFQNIYLYFFRKRQASFLLDRFR